MSTRSPWLVTDAASIGDRRWQRRLRTARLHENLSPASFRTRIDNQTTPAVAQDAGFAESSLFTQTGCCGYYVRSPDWSVFFMGVFGQ